MIANQKEINNFLIICLRLFRAAQKVVVCQALAHQQRPLQEGNKLIRSKSSKPNCLLGAIPGGNDAANFLVDKLPFLRPQYLWL